MSRRPPGATVVPMIRIWVDAAQPPTGRVVTAEGQPPQTFSGWLGLLGILADAISAGGVEDGPERGAGA
jgi:hypothetical protein